MGVQCCHLFVVEFTSLVFVAFVEQCKHHLVDCYKVNMTFAYKKNSQKTSPRGRHIHRGVGIGRPEYSSMTFATALYLKLFFALPLYVKWPQLNVVFQHNADNKYNSLYASIWCTVWSKVRTLDHWQILKALWCYFLPMNPRLMVPFYIMVPKMYPNVWIL